ncbi:MAG TPA: bifunctional demethylmenaquinone methyltransferase/2-methoxy-6-polyprenyl-1,4-benzoquinol methylase UbiE [Bacteroidales bacterium]|nr:bifunctional demethylmenaquinone methyltransferase/2-methoxy-6-polyprenyl-1,4-benzoquinol methylase UbiE [Bacteroidales bacterium]
MSVRPYKKKSDNKKVQLKSMFNQIAHSYDFLNHFLSFGIDRYWRNKAVGVLKEKKDAYILDVATGTADLAIRARKTLNPRKIIGIDISEKMLEIGLQKIKKKMIDRIELSYGNSESLIFKDNTFDAVMVAFGVRNFENLEKGLSEIYRVLAPGGKFVVLEFSRPQKFPVRQLYGFYFRQIIPAIGKVISKNSYAYNYLPESVFGFPEGDVFMDYLYGTGFVNASCISLTFGIASIYVAFKPQV